MVAHKRKIILGAVLLLVSSAVILTGSIGQAMPVIAASLAAIGLAAGALLVGTSDEGRPV